MLTRVNIIDAGVKNQPRFACTYEDDDVDHVAFSTEDVILIRS